MNFKVVPMDSHINRAFKPVFKNFYRWGNNLMIQSYSIIFYRNLVLTYRLSIARQKKSLILHQVLIRMTNDQMSSNSHNSFFFFLRSQQPHFKTHIITFTDQVGCHTISSGQGADGEKFSFDCSFFTSHLVLILR